MSYSERKGGLNSMQDSFQSQTHCFFKKPQNTKRIKRRRLVPQKYKCFYCARTLAHPAAEPLAERETGRVCGGQGSVTFRGSHNRLLLTLKTGLYQQKSQRKLSLAPNEGARVRSTKKAKCVAKP